MSKIKSNLKYYFWTTCRRKLLDKLLEKNKHYYQGLVLDIGGRDRGNFKKPKNKVERWIFADIEERHNPDIVLNVEDMGNIETESIDVINAIELFEHVEKVELGLKECYRVLRKNAVIIISVPFLYAIHADPYDFQRWTKDKWKKELEILGFKIKKFEIMGRYFTVLSDMGQVFIKSTPRVLRWILYLFYPLFNLLTKLDDLKAIKNHPKLGNFHGGYFIIAQK